MSYRTVRRGWCRFLQRERERSVFNKAKCDRNKLTRLDSSSHDRGWFCTGFYQSKQALFPVITSSNYKKANVTSPGTRTGNVTRHHYNHLSKNKTGWVDELLHILPCSGAECSMTHGFGTVKFVYIVHTPPLIIRDSPSMTHLLKIIMKDSGELSVQLMMKSSGREKSCELMSTTVTTTQCKQCKTRAPLFTLHIFSHTHTRPCLQWQWGDGMRLGSALSLASAAWAIYVPLQDTSRLQKLLSIVPAFCVTQHHTWAKPVTGT